MIRVKVRMNESLDQLLKRFKKACGKVVDGLVVEPIKHIWDRLTGPSPYPGKGLIWRFVSGDGATEGKAADSAVARSCHHHAIR